MQGLSPAPSDVHLSYAALVSFVARVENAGVGLKLTSLLQIAFIISGDNAKTFDNSINFPKHYAIPHSKIRQGNIYNMSSVGALPLKPLRLLPTLGSLVHCNYTCNNATQKPHSMAPFFQLCIEERRSMHELLVK